MALKLVKLDPQEDPSLYRFSEGAKAQLEADQKDYKILQEHIDYLNTVIESFEVREKAHKDVIKEMEAKNKFICDELIGEVRSLGYTVDYLKGELATLKQKYGDE